jgi:ABC-type uncharacterized transport system substrate-binding protein
MTLRLGGLLFALSASLTLTGTAAHAHPHVWVTVKSELVYTPERRVAGVRYAWTFDDMYSAFATQGITGQQKGSFTREELTPVVAENVSSLKEFDYFTFAKVDGKKAAFKEPVDYWGEFSDGMFTLHFFLPLGAPAKAARLNIEVFDPEFFIDFTLAEADSVTLAGAPTDCSVAVTQRPDPAGPFQSQDPSAFSQGNYGAMFANKIAVTCP